MVHLGDCGAAGEAVIKALLGAALLVGCAAVFGQPGASPKEKAAAIETATQLHQKAKQYSNAGNHEAALPLLEQALALVEQASGAAHPDTASALESLSETYLQLSQPDKALRTRSRALDIYDKYPALEGSSINSAEVLAGIYFSLAQYDKVLELLPRILAFMEKVFGAEDLRMV